MAERVGRCARETRETTITAEWVLDGTGRADVKSGIGYLDHMLDSLARHGLFDLHLRAEGDLHVDEHHTVEDVAIALGRALGEAVGDRRGPRRIGVTTLAIADHDVVSGLPEATAAGARLGVEVLAGIELTARWQGRICHLLG